MSGQPPEPRSPLPFLLERRSWAARRGFRRAAGVPLFVASLMCAMAAHAADAGPQPPFKRTVDARKQGLTIRVQGNGWGSVSPARIEALLYAVADELVGNAPRQLDVPIVVERTLSNPIALYERGPRGEYRVLLHASGEAWPLYAYEFAHELCHILSNFDENAAGHEVRANQWFEEALCETASLYVLRSLAQRWQSDPAMRDWREHAGTLSAFADRLLNEDHRQLPAGRHIRQWLEENQARLREDPYIRQKNEALANILLPLFERNARGWEAIRFLNLDPADVQNELREYLRNWYANCPTEHRHFIGDVMAVLGIPADDRRLALVQGGGSSGAASLR